MENLEITINAKLDKHVQKTHAQIQESAVIKAKSFSKLKEIGTLFPYIASQYNLLLSQTEQANQFEKHHTHWINSRDQAWEQLDVLIQQEKEYTEQKRKLELEIQDPSTNYFKQKSKQFMLILPLIILMLFSEAVYNQQAFLLISENNLISGLLSFGVSLSLLLYAHLTPQIIEKITSVKWKKISLYILSLGLVILLFMYLGQLRVAYLEKLNPENTEISVTAFLLVNMLLYISCALLFWRYALTPLQKKKYFHYKEKLKRVEGLQNKITEVKRKIRQIPQDLDTQQKQVTALLVYVHGLQKTIIQLYHSTIEHSKLEFELHTAEKIEGVEIPELNVTYNSTNIEDYE